jgi:outer membrane protein OmpA-like peptidoglycan-associated protein
MKNNVLVFVFLLFLLPKNTFSQDAPKIQWATRVLGVSSEYTDLDNPSSKQYKALQVLGKPDKLPAVGESPCAWSPERQNNVDGEWIKVGFDMPMRIQQIAVAENFNPGSITHIYVYDAQDKETLLFRNVNISPLKERGRIFRIMQKTDFEVTAVKIMMNTAKVSGFNQIDAIGISNSTELIEALIPIAEKKDKSFEIKSKPQNLGVNVNSNTQEIAPMITPDGKFIYFTRANHPENNPEAPEKQDVWFAEVKEDGSFGMAKNLGTPINNKFHNSCFSISPDGNTMLVNNIYNENGILTKGLSISRRDGENRWKIPEKVIIDNFYNLSDYSEFCLSQDGQILLMTIQANDAVGGKDIYFSRNKGDNTWTTPQNIGNSVNTASNETSPFLASDGKTLYFSTDGLSGYGSFDIFVSKRLDDTWANWSTPQNLGPEINTPEWDAYFTISAKADYAYYNSYYGSMGESDIFRVKLSNNQPDPVALVKGKVYNKKTGLPIEAKIVYELSPSGDVVGTAISNPKDGDYKVVLPLKKKYSLLAKVKGFLPIDEEIDLTDSTKYVELNKDLYLVPIEENTTIRLNHILFASTRYDLLPPSFPELNRFIEAMQENPTMRIQLEGHTEKFGKPTDQHKLAEGRLKSVKEYLIEKGKIDPLRIKTYSYASKRPITKDRSPQEQAKNRRVEIKILHN